MKNSKISVFEFAEELARDLNSAYKNTANCREDLYAYLENNNWFELNYNFSDNDVEIYCHDCDSFAEAIRLWLIAYKKTNYEKFMLLYDTFKHQYPITCSLYSKFIYAKNMEYEEVSWKLFDCIIAEIHKEITEYSEEELDEIIQKFYKGVTLSALRLFTEFLQKSKNNGRALLQWKYTFQEYDKTSKVKCAYSMDDFSVMAYYIFNKEAWERHNMLLKAIKSKKTANLWLYMALHFMCALRKSDIKRLEFPYMDFDKDYVKDALLSGEFKKEDAYRLADNMNILFELKPTKPSKTSNYSNVPNLKLFIPESLKEPFGFILATALLHRNKRTPIIRLFDTDENLLWTLAHIRNFFGDEFTKLIGNRPFSSLCANKSYLQGIESTGEVVTGKSAAKGYMMAALARSHKGGIGTLPKTTDVYLKDAKFSGYSPEFIIREMFERGIFSFIPAVLLEMITDRQYIKLSVGEQTILVKELGLEANQVEKIVSSVNRGLIKSEKMVKSLLLKKESAYEALQNIATGNAPGRCDEYLCMLTAINKKCEYPDRDNCLGCGYEIYTKSTVQTLMKEYVYLMGLKRKTSDKIEASRYSRILEQTILPTIAEIVEAAKILYNESDMPQLLSIVEKGIQYVDSEV